MPASQEIRVVAEATPKPGKEAELHQLLSSWVEPTRQEAGCLFYYLTERKDTPGVLVFVEGWESEEALHAHLSMDFLKSGFIQAEPLLVEPIKISILNLIK